MQCLHFFCSHAGVGPDLLWFGLPAGALLLRLRVFASSRVHGLEPSPAGWSSPSSADDRSALLLATFGGCNVALLRLELSSSASRDRPSGTLLWALPAQPQWVLCARLLQGGILAVGLCDNSCTLFSLATRQPLRSSHAADRCMLYSMALHGETAASLWRAAPSV